VSQSQVTRSNVQLDLISYIHKTLCTTGHNSYQMYYYASYSMIYSLGQQFEGVKVKGL